MYKELVEYFCLDVKKTTMEEFFGDIKTFLDFFEVRIAIHLYCFVRIVLVTG